MRTNNGIRPTTTEASLLRIPYFHRPSFQTEIVKINHGQPGQMLVENAVEVVIVRPWVPLLNLPKKRVKKIRIFESSFCL